MRLISFYLLTTFGACFLLLVCFGLPVNSAENKSQPCIKMDKMAYDFGEVEEGIKIKHTFKVSNIGTAPLIINRVYASCGCTIPSLEKKELKPGESGHLYVIVDTSMKQKAITKTVFVASNDPVQPLLYIALTMFVKDPHRNMKGNVGVKIFKDAQCAACHVDKGTNAIGIRLYQADCAMCHGIEPAKGAIGPALTGPYENEEFAKSIKQVISQGSKTHRSMPGFLIDAGGPLSKPQIDSLMQYLADVSKATK